MCQGKQEIFSWQRMKRKLIEFFFPCYHIQVQVLKEVKQVYVEENVFLEDHAKVKEEYIEISEEINEDPIVENDPEIKIVETIKEDHFEIVNHKILQDIDFIGVDFYLVNFVNCMKTMEKESLFVQLMNCKNEKMTNGLKYSKYLFAWHGRFQISTINLRMSFFQMEGSDVGQNMQFNFCCLLLLIFSCKFEILGFGLLFPWF